MKNEMKIPAWVSAVLLVLLCGAMYLYVNEFSKAVSFGIVFEESMFCLSCIMAFIYCIMGYRKSSSKYFQAFCIVYTLYKIVTAILLAKVPAIILLVPCVLSIAILGAFCFVKNLGKKKSHIMAAANMFLSIINLVASMLIEGSSSVLAGCDSILAAIFIVIVMAKYMDKDMRGTV